MTADGKRQVFVGQTVKYQWKVVEIVAVSPNGRLAKVKGNPHWIDVDSLTFADDTLFNSPMDSSPNNELYPVGTVLTNGAKESVKVVDRFKQDVKLQLGTVSGALATDFQPSDDEPFTMSEADLTEWLGKTLPSAAADTVPMPLPLHTWKAGERARLLCDLDSGNPFTEPLKEGTEGVVVKLGTGLGFKPDGWRAAVAYRPLKDKNVFVLDYCEVVVADSLPTPSPSPLHGEGNKADAPKAETAETVATDIEVLLERNAFLEEQNESLRFNNNLLNKEHDDLMQAREDNGKLMAALEDAQRSIRQLEKKNNQQSEMLREAVVTPTERQVQRVKTLMSTGGSNGFGETIIPHGYQIVAVTTEVYEGRLTRLIHLIGCGDSPTSPEDVSEKATVEFGQAQNSFEDMPILAAVSEYGMEAVKNALNDQVVNATRVAYENALGNTDWQPKRFELPGKVNSDRLAQKNDVIEVILT